MEPDFSSKNLPAEPGSVEAAAGEITRLLKDASLGDRDASEALFRRVLPELRKLASSHLAGERPGHMLQPTALVNEAYLRLFKKGGNDMPWANRAHFFSAAIRAIRQVLIDSGRKATALKRGGRLTRVPLPEAGSKYEPADPGHDVDFLVRIAELQREMETRFPLAASVFDLMWWVHGTEEETAEALRLQPAVVRAEWELARAYLEDRLRENGDT